MPKANKRAEKRRTAKIARAHSTELKLDEQVKPGQMAKRPITGYRKPARGVARYPWATSLVVLLILAGVLAALYGTHTWPFTAPAQTANKTAVGSATPTTAATAAPTIAPTKDPGKGVTPVAAAVDVASSPCVKIADKLTSKDPAPSGEDLKKITHSYKEALKTDIAQEKLYCAGINTNRGLMVLELDPKLAPNTVNNFVSLAKAKFYDGLKFHRVVPGFVIQTGDPNGDGSGGPGYKFNDEPVQGNYTEGTIAMANSGANTNGSQFFISIADNSQKLQKSYNLFGRVVEGLNVAKAVQGPGDDANSKNITPDIVNKVIIESVDR